MKQMNEAERQEFLELGVEVLETYIEDIFIDRRIAIECGMPKNFVDEFIAHKLRETDEKLSKMDEDEYLKYSQDLGVTLKSKGEEPHDPEDWETRSMELGLLEGLELKAAIVAVAKRGMTNSGADPDKLSEAIVTKAREHQKYIDSLNDDEFGKEIVMNIMKNLEQKIDLADEDRNQAR